MMTDIQLIKSTHCNSKINKLIVTFRDYNNIILCTIMFNDNNLWNFILFDQQVEQFN